MRNDKSSGMGYCLAFFLGIFGAHLFYYRKYIRAVIYILFSWTFVPMVLGWIDMIFVKRWTEEINNENKLTSTPPKSPMEKNEVKAEAKSEQNTVVEDNVQKEKVAKTEPTKSQKNTSFLKDAFVFYNEKDIILLEYSHLKTPTDILSAINEAKKGKKDIYERDGFSVEFSYSSSHKQFFEQSVKHAQTRGYETKEIPFDSYWPTFENLDKRQMKWYFYWREQALKGNYMDVDLSYIFLFVYELLNYSFNNNASLNISMLVRLNENYEERLPKLKGYLNTWIADMLYELGEKELATEWDKQHENIPRLYALLQEKSDSLERISISVWKPYIRNSRETEFFKKQKNKIYKKFKQSIPLLRDIYEQEEKTLLNEWFEVRENRIVRYLFRSAVMGRSYDQSHAYVTEYTATKKLYDVVSNLYRLSENIVRIENNEKREIKVDYDMLPEDMKGKMLKMNERFKTVKSKDKSAKGSAIPSAPAEEQEQKPATDIEFDWEEIDQKEEELGRLQNKIEATENSKDDSIGENTISTGFETDESEIEEEITPFDVETERSISSVLSEGDEDYEGFFEVLTDSEKEFILLFGDGMVSTQRAKDFVKTHGMMLGMFMTEMNEKAKEHLEDVLFEEKDDTIELIEDFEEIIVMVRSANVES